MANKKPNAKADDRYKKEVLKKAKVDKKKEKKLRPADAPKEVPKTLESRKKVSQNVASPEELILEDGNDAFSAFFMEGVAPKIMITTTRRASPDTFKFAEELTDLFPNSEFRRRDGNHVFKDVVKAVIDKEYTHLLVVNESRKSIDSLSVVKLPEGPTAVFKLTNTKLSKQIQNHGRSSSHTPELILNNFTTRLGHTVGRLFVTLFPHVPQFTGRQVVTFHNQRDFIFVRRHRYMFDADGRMARLQEIGPQFTLKLHGLYNAVSDLKDAPVEWAWKPHAIDSKTFAL